MSSSDDDEAAAAPFKPCLRDVAQWFSDRSLPYTPRLEGDLQSPQYGVTSLEEMKLLTLGEWESLLCEDTYTDDTYTTVKWRVFKFEFAKLTAANFDATKSKPTHVPIKDTSDAAKAEGDSKPKNMKRRGGGGNNGPRNMMSFFSTKSTGSKFAKPNDTDKSRSAGGGSSAASKSSTAEQQPASSSTAAVVDDSDEEVPLIAPHNWRSGRAGVDGVKDVADALERHAWGKSPALHVLPTFPA